jgi:uncharacterized protein YggU (UPF0235/DUF167 family)
VARAGADRVDGVEDGVLRCRVAAPAVGGAANEALRRMLADELGLPRSGVEIESGAKSRRKVVTLPEAARTALAARWPGLVG